MSSGLRLACIVILFSLGLSSAFHAPAPEKWKIPARAKVCLGSRGRPGVLPLSPSSSGRASAVPPLNQFVKGLVDEEDDKLNKDDIPPPKGEVPMASLMDLDIRAATIAFAETVPDPDYDNKPSRKYLKLKMEMGLESRVVVSAMRGIYDVEEAVGKKVLLVANVPKETILGVESHGKLLTASNPTKEPIPRTLRTVMLKPGNLPAGSTISAV